MISPTQETIMLTDAQINELITAADAGDARAEQQLLEALAQTLREIAGG